MQIRAQVKSNQHMDKITWAGDKLLVSVSVPAIEGQANKRVIELVAGALDLAKRQVCIDKGFTSPYKTLEIDLEEQDLLKRLNELEQAPQQLNLLQ